VPKAAKEVVLVVMLHVVVCIEQVAKTGAANDIQELLFVVIIIFLR
jgi:hypothetical protein